MNHKNTTNPAAIRSRTALSRAFVDLLVENPIDRITIGDITRRANLSRQTFYTNFSKKEDILEHSLKELFSMFLNGLPDLPESAKEMLALYFQFWDGHRTFLSVLFDNHFSYVFAANNIRLFENEFYIYAEKSGQTTDELPYLSSYLAGLTFHVLRTWQQSGWRDECQKITGIACKLLKGGCFL